MSRSTSLSAPERPDIAEAFDLRAPPDGFYDDPYPIYHALRAHAPVKRLPNGSYFLTRYDDLAAIYADTNRFSSDKKIEFKPKFGDSLLYEHHTTSLVFNDPPLHTRVRKLILGALMPKAVAAMEPGLQALVDRLLDGAEARGDIDLIADFAGAIPVEIIGNLLAVPHEDRGPLRAWSLAILGALEPVTPPQTLAKGEEALRGFLDYLAHLIADRRRRPGDVDRDVLTRLIAGEGDDRLTETELLQNCVFLLNAGHETTTNLIGNGLVALWRHPEERRRLAADPSLIKSAVDEVLRFESSNQLGNRRVTVETELAGVRFKPGDLLTLCIGAANRDPAHFEDPDRFDIARWPNRHLAFAGGPHQCAGMNLARLEGRVALHGFVSRFPHYELTAPPVRARRVRFRGFESAPARVN